MKLFKFTEFIKESQFYQQELNPTVWQGEEINPAIRTKLLQIANDFYSDLKISAPIEDIQLTGSLANYNWTKYSDFDVHVIMDLSQINDDVDVFSLKDTNESHRFLDVCQTYFYENNRKDAIFVKDISSAQRKWLYDLMEKKGFDKKRLYRLKTTFSKR